MSKPYLYWIVAPLQLLPLLRELAVQLGDGGAAERLNFSAEVCTVADPLTVVASGGCTGPVGQSTVDYLDHLIDTDSRLSAVSWARCVNEAAPARVVRSSYAPTQTRIDAGERVYWDLETALDHVGLRLYTPPEMRP